MSRSPGPREVGSYRRRGGGFGILQVGEILVLVLMYLQRSEELRVVIASGKTEVRAIEIAHYAIVVAAEFGCRGRRSASAIIVRGNRERPASEFVIVRA